MEKRVPRWARLVLLPALVFSSLGLLRAVSAEQGLLETPQPGSFQSGIGVIRGWVCTADRVDLEINGSVTAQAVYGELRGDTQAVCGDTNNGFSLQVNWNQFGEGIHTVRAVADGVEVGRAQVVVATLGQTYLQGAQGEFVVQPFPQEGKQTRIRWEESRQLFVLSNGGTPASGGASVRADARLEDPQPSSFQSGIGLVRGWVCSATRVEVELDGRTTVPAGYGQLRGDTQAACGDNNNGFSAQVNWNEVGDGAHTVRALADGVEIGRATFTVVTLGLGSFPTGLVGNFTVADFPRTGNKTQVQWQESQQNFVITGARFPGADEGLCTTRRGAANDGSAGTAAIAWGNPCLLSGNAAVLNVQTRRPAALQAANGTREGRAAAGGAFFLCASQLTIRQNEQIFDAKEFLLVDSAGNEICRDVPVDGVIDLLLQVDALSDLNFNAPFTVLYNGQLVVDFPGTPVPGTPKVAVSAKELNFSTSSATTLKVESLLARQGADAVSDGESRAAVSPCLTRSFTITNSGGGTLLGGMTLIANGSRGNVFSVISGGDINLNAGSSQATTVQYCPTSSGPLTGSVRISTNGGVKTVLLQVGQQGSGQTGTPLIVSASPSSLDFGVTPINVTVQRSFIVVNKGEGTLTGTADLGLGSPFIIVSGRTFNLMPGEEQTITIQLIPSSVGLALGSVTLNTIGGTVVVLLQGQVVDPSVPTPGSTPIPTPIPTPVPTPVPTPGPTPIPTPVPTPGPTPIPTPVPTPGPTPPPP